MTTYEPAEAVPPYYTDAALKDGDCFPQPEADKLLSIPAEYRQAAEAEVRIRTTKTTTRDGRLVTEPTGGVEQARTAVVAEIVAMLEREATR